MSFNIEKVAAKLEPFDLFMGSQSSTTVRVPGARPETPEETAAINAALAADQQSGVPLKNDAPPQPGELDLGTVNAKYVNSTQTNNTSIDRSGPLGPIYRTGGLVFPYMPSISETIGVKYDTTELIHSNEAIHSYRSTDNTKISLSNCYWTCDTFDNAVYALSVIHFFRSFTKMGFGKKGTGKPPSPMWFSAYGSFMYRRVPVLIDSVTWSLQNDGVDYVGVPDPGSQAFQNGQIVQSRDTSRENQPSTNSDGTLNLGSIAATTARSTSQVADADFTWIPMKLEISSISMTVQHSLKYWTDTFTLDDFYAGKMLDRSNKHLTNVPQ